MTLPNFREYDPDGSDSLEPAGVDSTADILNEAADACELLADIDESEHTDGDRLREVARILRAG